MKAIFILFPVLLSLNSWSAAKQRPTANFLPAGKCSFRSNAFPIPTTEVLVSGFEVYTNRRGTGCMKGQTHTIWKKCDIRPNETEDGTAPLTTVILKIRDAKTLKDLNVLTIPMTKLVDLYWKTDRKGNPYAIHEISIRENTDIEGVKIYMVAKRTIKNVNEDIISTELSFYQPGDKDEKIRSKLLYKASCDAEFTDKSYKF